MACSLTNSKTDHHLHGRRVVLLLALGLVLLPGLVAPLHAAAATISSSPPMPSTFSGTVNGPNPAPQTLAISSSSGALTWTVTDNAGWLTVTPSSGTTPGSITMSINPSGLAAGTYNGLVIVNAPAATNNPQYIPVTLTMAAGAANPAIGVSPAALSFSGTAGGANPASQMINVSNTGGGTLSWTATDAAAWLTLSPASGSNSGAVAASVNLSGLAAGTYNGTVTISATGATAKTVPVTLTVTAAAAAIGLSPGSLAFAATAGGANPAAQTLAISNTGGGTLNWTASDNAAWLTLSPASGTNTGSVTASINVAGLAAGSYTAMVSVSAAGATTKTMPVTLNVTAAAAATINVSPGPPTFSGTVNGANPAPQTFAVSSSSGALNWTVTDNAAWLTVTPSSSTTPGSITMSINPSGLAAGTYNGLVIVNAPAATNNPQYIPVTLTMAAGAATPAIGVNPAALSFSGTAGGANPASQMINVSNTGGGTLSWTATDAAAWLTLSPASGSNSGAVAASVNLSGLAAGTYNGTVTIKATGATTKTVPVTLTVTAAAAAIGLSPGSLAFAATAGGANPAAQTLAVSNTGGGTLNWTASDNAAWLTLSPASGTNTGSVTASINVAGLAAGSYTAMVSVSAAGATTKTMPVTLTIGASTTTPVIGITPLTLTFAGTTGGTNPSAKTITLSNTGGGTLRWTASDNAAWLSLSPASGTNTGTVTASVDLNGLAAGTYNATVTATATGATTKTVPVTLTVSAGTNTGTATLSWNANTETDLAGYKIYVGTQSGVYGAPISVGKVNTYRVTNLKMGNTYFFSVTAYDNAGNESDHSAEQSKSLY